MENMKWFDSLKKDEKEYIEGHPDISHMVKYLKQEKSFLESLKLGYLDYVREDISLYKYEVNEFKRGLETNKKI
jgi:hypothetical protein